MKRDAAQVGCLVIPQQNFTADYEHSAVFPFLLGLQFFHGVPYFMVPLAKACMLIYIFHVCLGTEIHVCIALGTMSSVPTQHSP